jgi:hypothetical protein
MAAANPLLLHYSAYEEWQAEDPGGGAWRGGRIVHSDGGGDGDSAANSFDYGWAPVPLRPSAPRAREAQAPQQQARSSAGQRVAIVGLLLSGVAVALLTKIGALGGGALV